jgi:alcohol dehydrogenase
VQNVIVQTYAKRTLQLVLQYLPIIYKEPSNIEAREKLAYAEFMAGSAFNCASLGFVHSLSHAVSGTFNTPHGLANALILPYVLDYEINNEIVITKLCELSEFLNISRNMPTSIEKAKIFLSYLVNFLRKLDIPTKLTDVQPTITKQQLKSMNKKAMRDFCGISNPVQFSRSEVLHIYQNIIEGKFENIKYEENS